MTRLTTLLSSVSLILSATLPIAAATITVGDFTYTTSGTKAVVSSGPTTGEVIIPESVTDGTTTYTVSEIAKNAFKNTGITSVTFPATVTKIGNNAFEGCKSLTKVMLVEGQKNIGSSAFKNCTALPDIDFPQTLTNLGSYSFDGCTSITAIVFPDNMMMAIGNPFQNCTSLQSITIGAYMSSFSSSSTCKGAPLEEILVSPSSTRLKSIDGVLYDYKGTKLEAYPEYRKDETFTLPASVTSISTRFTGVKYLKSFIGNDALKSIPANLFQDCPALESIQLGTGVSYFGSRCFTNCPKLKTVTIDAGNPYLKCVDGVVISQDDDVLYCRFPFAPGDTYHAPATLIEILDYAFYGNTSLKTVTMPDNIETLGELVFSTCTALTSVNIPASLTELPYGTFKGCKSLETTTLPKGLTAIGEAAFSGCYSLSDINIPPKVTTIGEEAFSGAALTRVMIPDAVETIGASAFYGCENLVDITVGSSVTSIGDEAFYNYSFTPNMTVYCKPATPPSLGSDTFIEGITIFVDKPSYDVYKADESYQAYNIQIHADLTDISITLDNAGTLSDKVSEEQLNGVVSLTVNGEINGTDFEYLNRMPLIKDINLSGATIVAGGSEIVTTLNEMPKKAVVNLTKLEKITLPENITAIADSSLYTPDLNEDRLLQSIIIPSTVTHIGAAAFANRLSLKEANLPEGLEYLGKEAYYNCESLASIELPVAIDTLREGTFNSCRTLAEVKFNEGLKVIEEYAFDFCKKIECLNLPNSVDSIGNNAFRSNSALKYVTLPENLRYLGRYTFAWCTELESIDLPETLIKIGASCFSGCDRLGTVKIPESVTLIDQSAFSLCPMIERVDVPRYVTQVGANAFLRNTSLRIATIAYDYALPGEDDLTPLDPDRLPQKAAVKYSAFQGCSSLEKVYIGSTVRLLENECFAGTDNLTAIYVASTTPPDMYDGENAFDKFDATLYVPLNSINTYMTNRHWKNFKKILPLELATSGIDDIASDNNIFDTVTVNGRTISFNDPAARVTISTPAGQLLYHGKAADVKVNSGIYIVTINSTTGKIAVR